MPTISRRFVVPADIRLDRLHQVIQIVMGWEDFHSYCFTIKRVRHLQNLQDGKTGLPCKSYRLCDLLQRKGGVIRYLYDFGDRWAHRLTIEHSNYPQTENQPQLLCLSGERNCPPEDIGGTRGFYEFLDALDNPKHPLHEEYIGWLGSGYRPDDFNINAVNLRLAAYDRRIP